MKSGVKWIGLGAAAVLLATSMPAMARPRYGYHHYPVRAYPVYGYGHYGRGYRHDGFDFGDFLLGAVVAGGIAAVVANSQDRDGRPDRGRVAPPPDEDHDAAADACSAAVERQAGRYSGDARVTDVDVVSRDGDGWRVEGVVQTGDDRSYRDSRRFQCGVRYGQVDFVQLGDELAVR